MAVDFDYLPAHFPLPGSDEYLSQKSITNSGTLATGALATGKLSRICRVPKGFVLTGWRFNIGDGDTGTALVYSIGDATTADRIVTTLTTGQAGGEVTAMNVGALLFEFTADTDIVFDCTTGATTAQAAAFKIVLNGYMK